MSAIPLMQAISDVLKEYDAQVVAGLIASIPARREKVAAVRAMKFTGQYTTTQKAYSIIEAAGGKGWLEMLRHGTTRINEIIAKTEAMKAEARNAKIAAKLNKAGITSVIGFESNRTTDGFTGRWTVETDKGIKSVFIDVILAGGYNIQCLHHRVLVNVK